MAQKELCCPLSTGPEDPLGRPVRIFGELGLRLYTAIKQTKRTNQEFLRNSKDTAESLLLQEKKFYGIVACLVPRGWVEKQ